MRRGRSPVEVVGGQWRPAGSTRAGAGVRRGAVDSSMRGHDCVGHRVPIRRTSRRETCDVSPVPPGVGPVARRGYAPSAGPRGACRVSDDRPAAPRPTAPGPTPAEGPTRHEPADDLRRLDDGGVPPRGLGPRPDRRLLLRTRPSRSTERQPWWHPRFEPVACRVGRRLRRHARPRDRPDDPPGPRRGPRRRP